MRILFFISLLVSFMSFGQTKDYKNYDKAVKYFYEGKIEKAIRLTLKLVEENYDWEYPHLLLASIYADQGEIDLSVQSLLNIYNEDDPEDIEGITNIAKLFYNNGRYQESIYYFDKLLQHSPDLLKKDISLSEVRNIHGKPIYKLSVEKILQNCRFALESMKVPFLFKSYNMGENINSSYAEYLPTISADDNNLFVTRRLEYEDGSSNEDFFVSKRTSEGDWTPIIQLGQPLNTQGNEGALALSADGSLLIFTACDRTNGYGNCDLYFSYKTDSWSVPINLGQHVNSIHSDKQPSLSPDGKYLYFVSNRNGGYGGLDIWKSEIIYNSYGEVNFKSAENIGKTINTKYNEMSPFIHADNLTLYFASDGHIGMGDYDLFLCRRINSDMPWTTPKNLGYPINTYKVQNSLIVASDGKTSYYASDQSGFGQEDIFWFELPEIIQADKVIDLERDIITNNVGDEIIFKNVQFAHNSFELNDQSFAELNMLIVYLKKNPNVNIRIEGHTDNVGNSKDNKSLSENRAKSVFNYLLGKGINPVQLSYEGFGEQNPITSNITKEGRAYNRRTSFRIIR